MTTQEKLWVMEAFLDGKKIQRKLKGDPDSEYVNLGEEPQWNWEAYSFRVSPLEIRIWFGPNGEMMFHNGDDNIVASSYTLKTFVEKV